MSKHVPSILSISYDESLLRTRHWILETAGFDVTSALGFAQAASHAQSGAFDLVIVGHSIPAQDKQALLEMLQNHHHGRILALCKSGDERVDGVAHWLESWEGPEALVSAVRKILHVSPASSTTQRFLRLSLISHSGQSDHKEHWALPKRRRKWESY
ncbi:MAG TPA: hypothetical protein VHA33_24220 [Candidatus Angelobacter sp.]|jgi:DNA-binding response OmpR family regulator|nr:hypothetical protein [Candidatus Angelobacter sp.]